MIRTYLRKTANGQGAPCVCLANAGAAAKPPARFRFWRNRRKAASEASRSAGSVLSSDGGVGKSVKEENIAKAAVRPF